MANYTERATLLVTDRSSKNVKKIDRGLKDLHKTALKLSKMKPIGPKLSPQAAKDADSIRRALADMQRQMTRPVGRNSIAASVRQITSEMGTARTAQQRLLAEVRRSPGKSGVSSTMTSIVGQMRAAKREAGTLQTAVARATAPRRGANVAATFTTDLNRAIGRANALNTAVSKATAPRPSTALPPARTGQPPYAPNSRPTDRYGNPTVPGLARRFPGNIPSTFNRLLPVDAYMGAREVVRTGGRAVANRSNENVTQKLLNMTVVERQTINDVAMDSIQGRNTVTQTDALAAGRNLVMGGATLDGLPKLLPSLLDAQGAVTPLLGRSSAARFGETVAKIADTAKGLDDPERGSAIFKAMAATQLATGRDLNFGQVLTGLRNLRGLGSGMTPAALADFGLVVEEDGRKGAAGVRSIDRVLSGNNVFGTNVDALVKSGLRLPGGGAVDGAAFFADPMAWVEKHIGARLTAANIDFDDKPKVRKAITEMGFQDNGIALIGKIIEKVDERARARANIKRINPGDINKLNAESIMGALTSVQAKFEDVAAAATPFADGILAPMLASMADELAALSRGELSATSIGAGVVAGAAGVGKVAISNADTIAFGVAAVKMVGAGTNLNAAAVLLERAAVAQGVDGLSGDRSGKKRGGKKGFWGLLAGALGSTAAAVGAAGLVGGSTPVPPGFSSRKDYLDAGRQNNAADRRLIALAIAETQRQMQASATRGDGSPVRPTARPGLPNEAARLDISEQIAKLNATIQQRRENGTVPMLTEALVRPLEQERTALQVQLESLGGSLVRGEAMTAALSGSVTQAQTSAAQIDGAANAVTAATNKIAGAFTAGAYQVGASIQSALATGVSVNAQPTPTNTGATTVGASR